MDLALIVPLALISGVLLLRRSAWGYLLTSVVLLKGVTLGLAISVMSINMSLKGVGESLAIMVPFLVITLLNLVMAIVLLRHIDPSPRRQAA
jgi:biotin transporter BioY